MTPRVKADARFTPAGLRLLLASVIAASTGVVFTVPVPVLPTEPPALVVTRSADRAAAAADARAASRLPRSAQVSTLREAIRDAGRRELHLSTGVVPMHEEAALAERAVRAATAAHGPRVLDLFRAALALEAERALRRGERSDDDRALLGGFRTAMDAWGLRRGGRVIAPGLVVRTLFKARVSVVLRREPTEGFSPAERRAYHGWLAMHGRAASAALRIDAATELARVDRSVAAREMLAFAMLADESDATAAALYGRLAEETGSTRLRNHARAVTMLAGR